MEKVRFSFMLSVVRSIAHKTNIKSVHEVQKNVRTHREVFSIFFLCAF